ncbi:MAG: metallophosphoesterase [Planctomycetota bacterium]
MISIVCIALLFFGFLSGVIAGILSWKHITFSERLKPCTMEKEIVIPRSDRWRVGIIGDPHGNVLIFKKGLQLMAARNVDAVIVLGDMVQYPTTASLNHFTNTIAESAADCQNMRNIFFLPGNHDSDDNNDLSLYKKYFGKTYHLVKIGRTLFLLLDNSIKTIDQTQCGWISAKLESASAENLDVILCMHVPLNSCGITIDKLDQKSVDFIAAMIETHPNIQMLLSGHFHGYATGLLANVPVVISGGGGGALEETPDTEFHCLVLEENPGKPPTIEYIQIPQPAWIIMKLWRLLYFFETLPAWFLWSITVICIFPITWLIIRRRMSVEPKRFVNK